MQSDFHQRKRNLFLDTNLKNDMNQRIKRRGDMKKKYKKDDI